MIIGRFTLEPETGIFTGHIRTLSLHRETVSICPSTRKSGRDSDYRVRLDRDDSTSEIGAAWKRTSGAGRGYLAVLLDDPAFNAPCDAALFFGADGRTAKLIWARARHSPHVEPRDASRVAQ
jgi:uncharacterized protein (DUF736 family)